MRITIMLTSTLLMLAIGCSQKPAIPDPVFRAAATKTLHLTTGQEANFSSFARSIYFSPKSKRYYCLDYFAKTTLNDLYYVSIYDEATASFRPVDGVRLQGLTLHIGDESYKPIMQFTPISVELPPQIQESK